MLIGWKCIYKSHHLKSMYILAVLSPEMPSDSCHSIYFQNFPGEYASSPTPPSISMLFMLIVLGTIALWPFVLQL